MKTQMRVVWSAMNYRRLTGVLVYSCARSWRESTLVCVRFDDHKDDWWTREAFISRVGT